MAAWQGLSVTWSLEFVGRQWEVVLAATGSFTSAEEQQHVWTQLFVPIAIGCLVSVALMVNAALMHRQGLRLTRAAINATERTHKYLIDYLCHEVRNPLQACLAHIDLAVPCLEAMVGAETPLASSARDLLTDAPAASRSGGGTARDGDARSAANGGSSSAGAGAGAGAGADRGVDMNVTGLEQVGIALSGGSEARGAKPPRPQLALPRGAPLLQASGDLPDILTDLSVARMAVTQVALVLDGIMNTKWWVESEATGDANAPDDSSTALIDAASVLAPAVVRDVGLILRDLSNQYRSVIDPGVVLYLQLPVQTREARLDSQKLRQVVEFGLRKAVNSANSGYISLRGGIVRPFFHEQDNRTPATHRPVRSSSAISAAGLSAGGTPASPAVRVATVSSPRRGDWFMCTVEFTPDIPLTQDDVDWGTHQELDGRARLGARVVGALTGAMRGTLPKEPSAKLPNNLLHAATGAHRVTMPGESGQDASTSSMAALVSRELRRRVGSSLPRPVCVAIVRAMGGVMGLQQTQLAQSGRDAVALARFWVAVPLDDGVRGPGSVDESSSE